MNSVFGRTDNFVFTEIYIFVDNYCYVAICDLTLNTVVVFFLIKVDLVKALTIAPKRKFTKKGISNLLLHSKLSNEILVIYSYKNSQTNKSFEAILILRFYCEELFQFTRPSQNQ